MFRLKHLELLCCIIIKIFNYEWSKDVQSREIKIKRNVKWSSKINIKEGLEKTFNWYFTNQEYFKLLKKKDIISRLGNKWLKKV